MVSDEAGGTSEEELSGGEVEASESQESLGGHRLNQDIKGMLMRKYSGYLSSLRKEFLKKRKKGKLPKDARMTLLDWWNNHYRWPYPTVITQNTYFLSALYTFWPILLEHFTLLSYCTLMFQFCHITP